MRAGVCAACVAAREGRGQTRLHHPLGLAAQPRVAEERPARGPHPAPGPRRRRHHLRQRGRRGAAGCGCGGSVGFRASKSSCASGARPHSHITDRWRSTSDHLPRRGMRAGLISLPPPPQSRRRRRARLCGRRVCAVGLGRVVDRAATPVRGSAAFGRHAPGLGVVQQVVDSVQVFLNQAESISGASLGVRMQVKKSSPMNYKLILDGQCRASVSK